MLQVCVERLRIAHPEALIQVITTAPQELASHCPGVEPLLADGRYRLTERAPTLPRSRRLARARLALENRRLRRADPAGGAFVEALLDADMFVMSGRGGLTDAFPEEALATLAELEIASRVGLPTALMGQGVGPLEDALLRARAKQVLPAVGLIALREGRSGPKLLEAAGVSPERTAVTGDDSIELALERSDRGSLGTSIGLSVRVAGYSGVLRWEAQRLGSLVRAVAERHGVKVAPIEMSTHPHEDDRAALLTAVPDMPAKSAAQSPVDAIDRIRRCRVVLAGSYHAAVFALAQGIPVVGLARTPYYVDKLLGLRERFGEGCRPVLLDGSGALDAVADQLEELWQEAPALRTELLAAAEHQIALGHAAYARLAALPARSGRPSPHRSSQASGIRDTVSEPVTGAWASTYPSSSGDS
jgi:colanic acid/amylovoran biosynthesis protein